MMSDLFGTPKGTRAAASDQLAQVLGGLKASQTLGEIEMQPAKLAETQAQTGYYTAHTRQANAAAALAEQTAEEQAKLGEILKSFGPQGPPGAPTEPGATSQSVASPFLALAQIAGEQGLLTQSGKLAKIGTDLAKTEAATKAYAASDDLRRVRAEQARAQLLGGIAAKIEDQAGWQQLQLAAQQNPQIAEMIKASGADPAQLPTFFDDPRAKSLLNYWQSAGTKASETVAQRIREAVAEATIAKDGAQATAANAAAGASSARAKVLKLQYEDAVKNGGDTTGGARALREARRKAVVDAEAAKKRDSEANAKKQASIDAHRFLALTPKELANPAERKQGQTYSTPKGPMTWTGQGWLPLGGAKLPAALQNAGGDEPDDELLNDEEE